MSLSAYAIWGGGVTVGRNPDGSWFFGGRIGFGVGGGLGFDTNAHSPGWRCGAYSDYTTGENSISAGVGAGPVEYARGITQVARNITHGYGAWHSSGGFSYSPERSFKLHFGAHAASGIYATFGNGDSSHCSCDSN